MALSRLWTSGNKRKSSLKEGEQTWNSPNWLEYDLKKVYSKKFRKMKKK